MSLIKRDPPLSSILLIVVLSLGSFSAPETKISFVNRLTLQACDSYCRTFLETSFSEDRSSKKPISS